MAQPTASGFFDTLTVSAATMAIYRQGRQAAKEHRYQVAIEHYTHGLAFGDTPYLFQARLLEYRGESYWHLCQFDAAIDDYQTALDLCDDQEQAARIRIRLGEIADFFGDYSQSQTLFQHALQEGIAANSVLVTAWARHGLGISLRRQGNTEQALSYLTQALVAFRSLGEAREQARVLLNIGRARLVRGEYQSALNAFHEALHIFRSLNDRWRVVQALNDIGACHHALYDVENALGYHERALTEARKYDAHLLMPEIECNLGVVLVEQGRFDEGLAYLIRALEQSRLLHACEQEALTLYRLARAYLYFPDHLPQADFYVLELTQLAEQLNGDRFRALAAFVQGELLFHQGQQLQAIDALNRAMLLAQTAVDRGILWKLHATMSQVITNQDIATIHLNIAIEFLKQTAEPLQDPQLKACFVNAPPVLAILDAAGVDPAEL